MKHQEYASDRKNDEEEKGDASQAEGIGKAKAMAFHLRREDMKEEVMIDHHGPFQIGIGYPRSEDRAPYRRF